MRKASYRCLDLIKKYEGCRLTAYLCPAGVWTIGYGHTVGVTKGMKITKEKAQELLEKDVERFEKAVIHYDCVYGFTQNEFDALVSFAFNMGSITKLTDLGHRSRQAISAKIPEYCNAGGVKLPGLVKRRLEEQKLFDTVNPLEELRPVEEVAEQVILNAWGTGVSRRKLLEKHGYNYSEVQAEVNRQLKGGK